MDRRTFLATVAAGPAAAAVQNSGLRAAAVKVDITPSKPKWLLGYAPRQSTGVHDKLYHRVVALDDGTTQFYLVSTDLCLMSPSVYDHFTAALEKETGIDRLHVWWALTHTHSGPEVGPPGLAEAFMPDRYKHEIDAEYTDQVERTLIDAIKQARAALQPARIRAGAGTSSANINRRARDSKGAILLGLNPDGPVDRHLGLLRVERPDGGLIALIANYAMHGTTLGGTNTVISADSPGIVAEYVEQKLGAPMLFINGACGNLAPIYTVARDVAHSHIDEFKVLLGDRILAANQAISSAPIRVKLAAAERIVETPRKPNLGWASDLQKYLRASGSEPGMVRLPVRFLRIGDDAAMWAAPIELFCEIAMHVRAKSAFRHTFYAGYTNGWFGYMPTRTAFDEGGYEIQTSPFTAQAEGNLTETVIAALEALREQKA